MDDSPQTIIDRLKRGQVTHEEQIPLLEHPTLSVRAMAIDAIAASPPSLPSLEALERAARSDANRKAILMGSFTVAHHAIAGLVKLGSDDALAAAQRAISAWPEPDREDARRYLDSLGLQLPGAQPCRAAAAEVRPNADACIAAWKDLVDLGFELAYNNLRSMGRSHGEAVDTLQRWLDREADARFSALCRLGDLRGRNGE